MVGDVSISERIDAYLADVKALDAAYLSAQQALRQQLQTDIAVLAGRMPLPEFLFQMPKEQYVHK